MATISTHTLNSVDGSHAGGVPLQVMKIDAQSHRTLVLTGATDEGGRFATEIDEAEIDAGAAYELVLDVDAYFQPLGLTDEGGRSMFEAVIRFRMPDPAGRYHMPFMLAPNSYSVWSSR